VIIDTGGLLIVLLVLTVPVTVWLIQRGKQNRTNALLAEIAVRQRDLAALPDPLAEINEARTPAGLDAAVRRSQARSEIASLTARLPLALRDEIRRGAEK
jgi:hypothetical protein